MSYISDQFGLKLALTPESGTVSGVAALFLLLALVASAINGQFGGSWMRELITPRFAQWKLELNKSHAKWLACLDPWGWLTPLLLQTLLDVLTVGCVILLIVTAALSKSAYLGCSIFFIGCTFLLGFMTFFSIAGEGFQLMYSNIHRALLFAVICFGIFVLVQLLLQGNAAGDATYSFRATGALWVGVSVLPLFFYHDENEVDILRREGRGNEGDEPTDIDDYPASISLIPAKYSRMFAQSNTVLKALSLLSLHWWIWAVSLIPIFIFALTSMFHTSRVLDAGMYAMATIMILEWFFQLIGNSASEHIFLVVFNRFLLVCVGQEYWLVGTVAATTATASFALNSLIKEIVPSPSSAHRGELILKALDVLVRLDKSVESQSQKTAAAPSAGESGTESKAAATKWETFLNYLKKPIVALLAYNLWLAITLGIGSLKNNLKGLPQATVNGMKQFEWAVLIWLLWFTSADLFFVYRIVQRNGFGHSDVLENVKKHLTGGTTATTPGRCAQLTACIASFLAALSDAVKENMDEPHAVGALLVATWLMTIGSSVLASWVTGLWIMVPLITLLPASMAIFFNFVVAWGKAGCPMLPAAAMVSTSAAAAPTSTSAPAPAPVADADAGAALPFIPRSFKDAIRSWLVSAVLFVLAIGTGCAPPATAIFSVYLGLWLLGLAVIALTIVRWRSTLVIDSTLMLMIFTSWMPIGLIWSLVCGLRINDRFRSHGGIVAMLVMLVTAAQLAALASFIWKDCMMLIEQTGVAAGGSLLSPQAFLQGLVFSVCGLLLILLSLFAAYVSTPMGVALIMLLLPLTVYLGVKARALKESGRIVKFMTDQQLSLVTYASSRQTDMIVITIFCLLVAGAIGAVSHPSHSFWWASFCWFALAFCALAYGVYDLLYSPPKVYGVMFYPVYSMNAASSSVENVSLKSSFILIFLAMLAMWAVWCAIIVLPYESGLVLFVITTVTTAVYIRTASKAIFHDPIDDITLAKAKEVALKRIYSSEAATATSDETFTWAEREDQRPVKDILHAVGNDLREKIRDRKDAEDHVMHLLAEYAQIDNELSPLPFVHLFAVLSKWLNSTSAKVEVDPKDLANARDPTKPRPTVLSVVRQTENPMVSESVRATNNMRKSDLDNVALDVEGGGGGGGARPGGAPTASSASRDSIPGTNASAASPSDVKFRQFDAILEAHSSLKQKVTDLNRYHAFFLLKARNDSDNLGRLKTKELVAFLKGDAALNATDDNGAAIFTEAQVEHLKSMTAEELTRKFPSKKVAALLEAYRKYQQDKETARQKQEEKRNRETAERDAADAKAKEDLIRIAQEERRKAAEIKVQQDVTAGRSSKIGPMPSPGKSGKPKGQTRDPFPVAGRFGVPQGESLEDVVKQLGLTRGQKFRDTSFDLENSLEDALGVGSNVAKNASSYSALAFTDKFASQISTSKATGKLEHGCIDPVESKQVLQGALGDCYFLSALANMAEKPGLIRKLFPLTAKKGGATQDTWRTVQETAEASSVFAVRLFFNGEYRTVVVDDLLVGHSTENPSPLFAKGNGSHEQLSIWVMLVEKAYAKLHGTFASIEGGFEHLAMSDLTGGVPGTIEDLQTDMDAKWDQIKLLYEGGHLLGAGSGSGSDTDISDEGIVKGHAYSILQVRTVDQFRLICMRNPWGGDGKTTGKYRGEWNGAWSDKSPEWEERYKRLLGWEDKNDGKFWIEFEDFVRVFRCVYVCRLFPVVGGDVENAPADTDEVKFRMHALPRPGSRSDERLCQWKKISDTDCGSAGGCSNHATYERNPQFVVTCNEDTTITIVLSQSEDVSSAMSVSDAKSERNGEKCMGLAVFDCDGKRITGRGGGFTEVARSKAFSYSRDTVLEFRSKANAAYTVVPALFEKGEENKFSMRAYARMPSEACGILLLPVEEYQSARAAGLL